MSKPTTAAATITAVIDWHKLGANLGGISNAMSTLGLLPPPGESAWCSEVVRAVLVEAGVLEAGGGAEDADEDTEDAATEEPVDWKEHCGARYKIP